MDLSSRGVGGLLFEAGPVMLVAGPPKPLNQRPFGPLLFLWSPSCLNFLPLRGQQLIVVLPRAAQL